MKLEGKCVKVIDSDITEDTCWTKCYSYVITKDIHVLNNVKLSVQDGACVYLLNGKPGIKFNYKGGSIIFDAGSKLCAGNLLVASVVSEDGKYVISTKINSHINNNGIKFFGTKEELDIVNFESSNSSKSDMAKLYRKKINELKKNMVKENNQQSNFVFKSLNLEYIGSLSLEDLDTKEFCGKNINIFNLYSGNTSIGAFFIHNTNIYLDNLEILIRKPNIQENTYPANLQLSFSNLTIAKSLKGVGGNNFIHFPRSNIVLNKCSKILLEVANFSSFFNPKIEPKGILPNINFVPYVVNKCLKEKVVITTNY